MKPTARVNFLRGFSYIEIIFTVAILALLATTAVPYAELAVTRKKEVELKRGLRQIRTAIDDYKKAVDDGRIRKTIDESGYPHSLDDLVRGIADITSPEKKKLYFLRRLPKDPMTDEINGFENHGWGLRSYDSSPEIPLPGRDVFDVYSLSQKKGLNGVPYSQW